MVNSAVAALRGCPPTAWDCDVHLPRWVSSSEAQQIRERLEGWVGALLALRPALLATLAAELKRPLRCVWVCQGDEGDEVRLGEVGRGAEEFTPLVLISASLPNYRQRRCLTLDTGALLTACGAHEGHLTTTLRTCADNVVDVCCGG